MPLTLDDLRERLNASAVPAAGTSRAAEWQRALDTATGELTRMTGWLDATTTTVQVSTSGYERVLPLPYMRLASIGAVTDPGGFVVVPYRTNPLAGIVELSAGTPGVWSVVCTGTPWPAGLSTAALDWAAYILDTQRVSLNPAAAEDEAPPMPPPGLPNRVAEFARPYAVPGIA